MTEILVDADHAVMDRRTLLELREYNQSLPTGTTIGKRWRRWNYRPGAELGWWLGEYVPSDAPGCVDIEWRQVLLIDPCEGVTARWCPNHGDCACDYIDDLDSDACRLHGRGSDHAREWQPQ